VKRFKAYVDFGGWDVVDREEYTKLSFETFLQLKCWIVGVSGSYELIMLLEGVRLDEIIWNNEIFQVNNMSQYSFS